MLNVKTFIFALSLLAGRLIHSIQIPVLIIQSPALITHLLSSQHDVGGPIESISVINTVSVHLQGAQLLIVFAFFQMVTKRNTH